GAAFLRRRGSTALQNTRCHPGGGRDPVRGEYEGNRKRGRIPGPSLRWDDDESVLGDASTYSAVIPAQAGTYFSACAWGWLGPRLRGDDSRVGDMRVVSQSQTPRLLGPSLSWDGESVLGDASTYSVVIPAEAGIHFSAC